MRKLKAEQRKTAAKQRPGKRQRAELKAVVFQHADGPSQSTASKPIKKKQKTQEKQSKDVIQGKKLKAGSSNKKQRKA